MKIYFVKTAKLFSWQIDTLKVLSFVGTETRNPINFNKKKLRTLLFFFSIYNKIGHSSRSSSNEKSKIIIVYDIIKIKILFSKKERHQIKYQNAIWKLMILKICLYNLLFCYYVCFLDSIVKNKKKLLESVRAC